MTMLPIRRAALLALLPLIAAGCAAQVAPAGGGNGYGDTPGRFQGDGSGGEAGYGTEPVIGGGLGGLWGSHDGRGPQ
jgi:hypothetical protein